MELFSPLQWAALSALVFLAGAVDALVCAGLFIKILLDTKL